MEKNLRETDEECFCGSEHILDPDGSLGDDARYECAHCGQPHWIDGDSYSHVELTEDQAELIKKLVRNRHGEAPTLLRRRKI